MHKKKDFDFFKGKLLARKKNGNIGFPSPHFANFGLGKVTVPLYFSR